MDRSTYVTLFSLSTMITVLHLKSKEHSLKINLQDMCPLDISLINL